MPEICVISAELQKAVLAIAAGGRVLLAEIPHHPIISNTITSCSTFRPGPRGTAYFT